MKFSRYQFYDFFTRTYMHLYVHIRAGACIYHLSSVAIS